MTGGFLFSFLQVGQASEFPGDQLTKADPSFQEEAEEPSSPQDPELDGQREDLNETPKVRAHVNVT